MFYTTTETERFTITSSYSTEKQALRYGGEPVKQNLHLMDDGFEAHVVEFDQDLIDIGKVRSIFTSKLDGSEAGRFLLYLKDEEGAWYYSGINFSSYSDANGAIKGPLSKTFGDMLIVENEELVMTSKESDELK